MFKPKITKLKWWSGYILAIKMNSNILLESGPLHGFPLLFSIADNKSRVIK